MTNLPEKSLLRKQYEALRGSIDPSTRQEASSAIYRQLFELDVWREASLLCGYVSVRGEIDTLPILQKALDEGKTLALPCTITGAREGRMIFRKLTPPRLDILEVKRFGILEPSEHCPEVSPQELSHSLMLLPGLAFDADGYRLGYGGGYYDRYIANANDQGVDIPTVALSFDCMIVQSLPKNEYDIPAHIIVTERRVHIPHGK